MRIGARIGAGFVAALAVVGVLGALSWSGARELLHTIHQVDRTRDVLDEIEDTRSNLIDVESGSRGYVITGRERYLEPYLRGLARTEKDLGELRAQLADRPSQTERLNALEQVARKRVAVSRELVALRRQGGFDAAAATVKTGKGKALMDQARALLDQMKDDEVRLLNERTALARRRANQAFAFIVLFGGGMALLVLAATGVVTRSMTRPLSALARAAATLGRGGRVGSAELERSDEIGDLARVLDQMDRQRAAAEARERQLLELAPEAFFLADIEGHYTDVNSAACELLGYARDELLGKTVMDLIVPRDSERLAQTRERLLQPGQVELGEWCLQAKDGTEIPTEIVARILPDGRWQAFVRDLRERKRLEAVLRESEERFRLALDEAPIGMALVGLDGRFFRVNAAYAEIVGYSIDELVGLTFQAITEPDDLEADLALAGRLVRGEIPRYQLEKRYLRKDGSRVPVLLTAAMVRSPTGAPLYYIAEVEDISERKQAEAERERVLELERQHRRRLETIREASLAISALQPAAYVETIDALLQSIVEEARRLTGADYGALGVGTDPERAFEPWTTSGMSQEEMERIGRRPRPVGVLGFVAADDESLRLDRVDQHPTFRGLPPGHPPMGAYLGVPIRRGERAVGNLYLAKRPGAAPFTADDQAAVELLASPAAIAIENARLYHKLQAALRAREEMQAVVSHDLKNPLSAISLRADLLGRRLTEADLAAHAASIKRASGSMRQLITRLLDAASLETGSLRLDLGDHDLAALAQANADLISPLAQDRGIELQCHVPVEAVVACDGDRIAQVLSNLLGNAMKFTPEGRSVSLRVEPRPGEVVVSVQDTGPGIPPETLPHIFERYFTTARGQRGAGLGLYIVKGIVEAHGGRVWVDSEVGRGSTFFFSLPERRVSCEDASPRQGADA